MYYRLSIDTANMSQYWECLNNQGLRLGLGFEVDVEEDNIELPFRLQVSFSPDLAGLPKIQPLYEYVSNVKVMSKRLLQVIQSAGVDNLQTFPALVTDAASGRASEDFVVFNVLGMVSAVDLAQSKGTPLGSVFYFDKIAIDPLKARGLLLFRIKQSPVEVIVHESVARLIGNSKIEGLVLEPASTTPPPP
jgi:hypothetical protein